MINNDKNEEKSTQELHHKMEEIEIEAKVETRDHQTEVEKTRLLSTEVEEDEARHEVDEARHEVDDKSSSDGGDSLGPSAELARSVSSASSSSQGATVPAKVCLVRRALLASVRHTINILYKYLLNICCYSSTASCLLQNLAFISRFLNVFCYYFLCFCSLCRPSDVIEFVFYSHGKICNETAHCKLLMACLDTFIGFSLLLQILCLSFAVFILYF